MKRRPVAVRILSKKAAVTLLICAVLCWQNEQRQTASVCMMVKAVAQIDKKQIGSRLSLSTKDARSWPLAIGEFAPA